MDLPEKTIAQARIIRDDRRASRHPERRKFVSAHRARVRDKPDDSKRISARDARLASPLRINDKAQIDVIDITDTDGGGISSIVRVLIYEEQYSKFIVLRALRSADPKVVAAELVDIVTTIGGPRIIQSANGRDYAKRVVGEIRQSLRDFRVVDGDASENVETARRDFRTILNARLTTNPGTSLPDALRTIQVSENTSNPRNDGRGNPSEIFFARNTCEDLRRTIGAGEETSMKIFNGKTKHERWPNLDESISKDLDESANMNEPNFDLSNAKIETLEKARDRSDEIIICTTNDKDDNKLCDKYDEIKLGNSSNLEETRRERRIKDECEVREKSFRSPSLRDLQSHATRYHHSDVIKTARRMKNDEDDEKTNGRTRDRKISKYLRIRESRIAPSNDKNLECSYCNEKFNFPSVLKRHVRSHTNERPYACVICKKSYKQLGHLNQHGLTHAIEAPRNDETRITHGSEGTKNGAATREIYNSRIFECDDCKKIFTTKSILERHIGTHTHQRRYACDTCGKRFKQAGHVKSHMLVHTGERKFSCPVCSRRFALANSLKKHMYVHNGDKPYQCDICGSRFLEKRNLNGHLTTHTNEKPFSCKICGKRYTLADTLRRHVSAAHEDGRTYQCEICAKMFKQLAHLSVHKKVHNDERPFQCHLCEKNFKHKNVLKSHLAVHANVRPFECDSCESTFVRKTNLQTHIASAHTNERPYVCTICDKRFKQISHLNGHTLVHGNSMPYQCDFCDRRCNRLDNLKKHMRLHDKRDKE